MGITTANIQDITSEEFEGTGVFDALMRSAKAHLEREYTENRIRGNDYATVYTSMLGSVLQASIQYSLEKPLREERVQAELDNMAKQGSLIDAQASKLAVDEALVAQQDLNLVAESANIPKQGSLIDAQKAKVDADKGLVAQQDTNLISENTNIGKQGTLLDAQVTKTNSEQANVAAGLAAINKQADKIQKEIDLLGAKKTTENAQTTGSPGGVIGKQIALYDQQIAGYKTDRAVKGAKLYTDVLSVQLSTNPEEIGTENTNMDNTAIGVVMGRVLNNIPA